MSDDGPNRDGKKEHPIQAFRAGKGLLGWLTPTSSSSQVPQAQPAAERDDASGRALNRRSYMLLAGGAAVTAATGGVASAATATDDDENETDPEFGTLGYGTVPYGYIER